MNVLNHGRTGSADGPAPNSDGTSADAVIAMQQVLVGRLILAREYTVYTMG